MSFHVGDTGQKLAKETPRFAMRSMKTVIVRSAICCAVLFTMVPEAHAYGYWVGLIEASCGFGADCRAGATITAHAYDYYSCISSCCTSYGHPAEGTIRWSWGDGTAEESGTATASHVYAGNGTYFVVARGNYGVGSYGGRITASEGIIAVDNQDVTEGATKATISVRRDHRHLAASVNYNVLADKRAGIDYLAVSGTLVFAIGESVKTFDVPVLRPNDLTFTGNTGPLTIYLTNPTQNFSTANGRLMILDDDWPEVIAPERIYVSRHGYTDVAFDVRGDAPPPIKIELLNPPPPPCCWGCASPSYFNFSPSSIAFVRGSVNSTRVSVNPLGSTPATTTMRALLYAGNVPRRTTEITVYTTDDDPPVWIDDASFDEGNDSQSKGEVSVRLLGPPPNAVDVHYATSDDTARARVDYTPVSGSVTFAPGETLKTISVPLLGDLLYGNDKTFRLTVTSTALVARGTATCTIRNDDADLAPSSLVIETGRSTALTLRLPRPADGLEAVTVTSNSERVNVPAKVVPSLGQKQIDIPIAALQPGWAALTVSAPTFNVPDMHAAVTVWQPTELAVSIEPNQLQEGSSGTVTLTATPPPIATVSALLTVDPTIIRAPASIFIPASGRATFDVQALAPGWTWITAQLPSFYGNGTAGLQVQVIPSILPRIDSIEPAVGVASGGTAVTIRGAVLDALCVVTFGGAVADQTTFADGALVATTPAHAPGIVDVEVSCASGTTTWPRGFEYVLTRPRAVRH